MPDLKTELLNENKALQARIQELERTLENIASLAKFPSENPNPVFRIADDGTVLYANEVAESMLKTLNSGMGQSAPDLWHRQVLDAMASGRACLFDVEYFDRIFSFSLVPVQNAPYVNWYGRDVTERRAAEATLAFSRSVLNDTGKMAKIGGWEHDLRTRQATWTEALYDIIGIPYDQPIPGPDEHLAYYPEKDREILRQAYQKAIDEHVPFDLELQGHTRNKKLLWFRAYGEPVVEDGPCVKMRGTFQDITQQKQTEQALKDIEWLLTRSVVRNDMNTPAQPYGDLSELASSRRLIDCVGKETLNQIVSDSLVLLDTSAAVYEVNGDYSMGLFSSGWCRFLDQASRQLCDTPDNRQALGCGKWHCHESCWNNCSAVSIETGRPVDIECAGGIRIYAIPIVAGDKMVGSINFGYGDPPKDLDTLRAIAGKYEVSLDELIQRADGYQSRPLFIIDLAKRRLETAAQLIGEIVERKQAQEEIENLAKFPSENPSPVLRASNNGSILYANAACRCLLEKWGCRIGDLLPRDLHHRVTDTVRTGKVQQCEVECCQIIYLLTFAPIKESDFVNIYGLDITDQKNSENELRKSLEREQFLGNIIRDASVAIGIGYPDGRLRTCNQAFVRLTGYTEKELQNIDWNLTLTPQAWRAHEAHYLQQLNPTHNTVCYEKEYIRKDGTLVPVELLAAARFDTEGTPLHYIGFVSDITDRKTSEEKTRQAQEQLLFQQENEKQHIQQELDRVRDELVRSTRLAAIGQVSASIAHDLRNPLAAVHNAIYLLTHYLPEPEEKLTRQLAVMDKEIKRSNEIITNLLNLARAKKPDKQVVSLRQLVQQTVEHIQFPEGIDWQVTSEPDPFMLYADPTQLGQVTGNLFVNAIEAMAGSGKIFVEAQQEGANQVIRFRDTGPGFSPQIKGDPREPLITTKTTGTGLGLTICRDIIAQHGGTLTIEKNTEPGAVVCVTLPKK